MILKKHDIGIWTKWSFGNGKINGELNIKLCKNNIINKVSTLSRLYLTVIIRI